MRLMSRPALKIITGLAMVAGLVAACAPAATPAPTAAPTAAAEMDSMDMGAMGAAPTVPAGLAYAEGQEIRFIHTEVSDADIAQLLSDMMASPVLVVPALAEVPATATAPVYVFTNGLKGMGPLGFQPDVFPNPPGTAGYTPLRAIHLVTWVDESQARELKAAAEVHAAEQKGELKIEQPGVVVNMPFITWPGGER
ncbi:MAG: hypothetical protein JNK29_18010 [Anaerolineales bacterium]|nr:hypothetical protein [Anaerolineales bacterium]